MRTPRRWARHPNSCPPNPIPKGPPDPRPEEHNEQVVFVQYLERVYPAVRFFAVPNAGQRHPAVAAKMKAEGMSPGVPDMVIPTARGGYFGLYIEMKKQQRKGWPKPTTRGNQQDWILYLYSEGYKAVVCYGAGEAITAIDAYMSMERTKVSGNASQQQHNEDT